MKPQIGTQNWLKPPNRQTIIDPHNTSSPLLHFLILHRISYHKGFFEIKFYETANRCIAGSAWANHRVMRFSQTVTKFSLSVNHVSFGNYIHEDIPTGYYICCVYKIMSLISKYTVKNKEGLCNSCTQV